MRSNIKNVGITLAALLCASTSGAAIAADSVIILTDNVSAADGLRDRLVVAGYDVTTTQVPSDLTGSLSNYKQVWDVRMNAPLESAVGTSYLDYLNGAGGLFLLGENSGFALRNNSIVNFIIGVGGGDVQYGGGLVTSQYVTDVFNGAATVVPDSLTSFYVPASGTFATAGNGVFITTDGPGGTGAGTGIAFGAGSLQNAPTGRLLTYLDVNTFQANFYNATPALRSLIDRMIGFVAGTVTVTPTPTAPLIIDASQPSFNLSDPAASGTTITFDGGTLDMTGGPDPQNIVTADVAVENGGAFINTAGGSSTLAGTISGTGGLIVSGQGTLALGGTNTYAGGTVISDFSTVQIDSGAALGTGGVVLMNGRLATSAATTINAPVTLMNGVNVIDTGSNDAALTGSVTGNGGFIKTGSGRLVLSGANSHTGGTTVQAGTLAGDTTSLVGDIANAGVVEFAQGADGTYAGALSGTGGLVKTGSGRLVLSGANSHTGGTIVQAGTLAGDTTSIVGDIANAGVVEFAQGTDGAYAGALSGTGALVKAGNGRLVLSGANSHTGGTLVQAGTLAGDTTSLVGDIANSGVVEFAQGTDGAYAGALSGTGGLVKTGSGRLVLSGANSHTGGTIVQAGTLAGDTNSLVGDIANAGVVEFAQGADGAYAGALSGTGGLVKTGSGRLVLSGANSHTGGTIVQAGTLAGDTTSLVGDIANAGVVEFAQGTDGAYAGALSGTGALVKAGNGRLVLSGANSHTGGTIVQAGTLAGDTTSLVGDIANAGVVEFAQGTDGAYAGALSGTGGLVKTGSGRLVLSGANSHTGGTIVQAGTLAGDTTSLVGDIANAGVVEFAQGTDGVYAGALSGTGGLVKTGSGRLTLSGANSHAGGTIVQAGTLAGDTTSLVGDIANAGMVEFAQGTDGAYAGALSGTGGLVKTGSGRLVLSGANSHTGGTIVQGGTLAGDTTSLVGDIANAGVVEFAQGTDGAYAGALSGTGGLVKAGNGRLVLSGANSHAGGTIVQAGTLAGDSTSLVGNIVNAGVVEFAQGTDGTYGGALSGTGGLVKTGSGRLTLSGANAHTGGTVVQAGTLAGDTNSLVGDIANAGAVEFAQNMNGTYAGTLSGTGALVKTGGGRLNLTGASSFAGDTIVQQGLLAVNGSISQSRVGVDAGATIGGNGLVGGLIVRNGATAAPGNSIGEIRAATTVLFEPTSVFQVEVDATGASDRVVATGTATLEGGTVQVLAENGNYRPQTHYSILQAARVDGEFSNVTSNLAFLMPTLSYTPTEVSLTLTRNDVSFTDVALTANQFATASAIETSFAPSSELYYALVDQDAQSARTMFDHLSGEVHASALNVAVQNTGGMRHALLQKAGMAGAPSTHVWVEGTGAWSDIDGNGNAVDVSADSRGLRGGIEAAFGTARFGIAAGHDDGDLRLAGRSSSATLTSTHAGVYAAGTLGRVGVRAGATHSWLDIGTARDTAPALAQQLTASYDGRIIQGFAEAGYSLPVGPGALEPFAGVDALWLKTDGFREQGGSLALTSVGQTQSYVWSTLGAKGSFGLGSGSPISANFKAGWQHALSDTSVASDVAFANGGPIFSIEGAPLVKDAGLLDVGLSWDASRAIRLGVSYTGTLSDRGDTHAGRAALSIAF